MIRIELDNLVLDFLDDLPLLEQRNAIRRIVAHDDEQRAEIERLQAKLETAKWEVWSQVIAEFERRHCVCLLAMTMPYAENEWRGKADLLVHLLDWCQQENKQVKGVRTMKQSMKGGDVVDGNEDEDR